MFNVRYYEQVIHPDHFRRGGGLGLSIRVLNWLRWKLETAVQFLVLHFLARKGALPATKVRNLVDNFRADVAAEKVVKLQTSPDVVRDEAPLGQRADKYAAGAFASVMEDARVEDENLPTRPQPIDDLIARLGHETRSKRYSRGHRHVLSATEDDFEVVTSPRTLPTAST